MRDADADTRERTWGDLTSTAAAVRASIRGDAEDVRAAQPRRRRRGLLVAGALVGLMVAGGAVASPPPAAANGTEDAQLFQLTNQDRASNGVPALVYNYTLQGIGEATPYHICGITVPGRSQDMINRSYFSHQIPPCGQYVFVIMQEAGIGYRSAGENIGWASYGDASYINQQFMASPDHRANILNANFTHIGVGSASAASWMGYASVTMFSEEFVQLATAPAPPPPPPPPHTTTGTPTRVPTRNQPVNTTNNIPPASTAAPTPPPTPVPTPVPTPQPSFNSQTQGLTAPAPVPLIWAQGGLLSDSVESVLESFLID